jgi:hypothetical protein
MPEQSVFEYQKEAGFSQGTVPIYPAPHKRSCPVDNSRRKVKLRMENTPETAGRVIHSKKIHTRDEKIYDLLQKYGVINGLFFSVKNTIKGLPQGLTLFHIRDGPPSLSIVDEMKKPSDRWLFEG